MFIMKIREFKSSNYSTSGCEFVNEMTNYRNIFNQVFDRTVAIEVKINVIYKDNCYFSCYVYISFVTVIKAKWNTFDQ